MIAHYRPSNGRLLIVPAALMFLVCGFCGTLFAQSCTTGCVEGFSAILNSTTSSEIDTWHETYISADVAYYYGAMVVGHVYQNSTIVNQGYADETPYVNEAAGELTTVLLVGNTYTAESDHYLVESLIYGYDSYGDPLYYNPDYFLASGGSGSDPSGWNFSPGGGPVYYTTDYIYLGSTAVGVAAVPPFITSISPTGAALNTSGQITITGTNLVDTWTLVATPAITGSGVTLTVGSQSSTQVVLNYTIANNPANSGTHQLTLSDRFGSSNAVNFTVGDPTPNVTGVSPSVWNAGTNPTVTISGTGFGTNMPTVTVPNASGVSVGTPTSYSDTQISVPVTISPNAPNQQSVTVQVQSNGYTGNGFIATTPGQQQSGSKTVSIQAIQAAPPTITFNGQQAAGTTQNVIIGQQIPLVASITVPGGTTIQSESWSGPDPAGTVGGFGSSGQGSQPTSLVGGEIPMPSQTCATSSNTCNFTYYYVTAESADQVVFSYSLSNGTSASSWVTFKVQGLTGNLLPNAYVQTDDSATRIDNAQGNPATLKMTNAPNDPNVNLNPIVGIRFDDLANLPQGSLVWVQVIQHVNYSFITPINSTWIPPANEGVGLDGVYPYPAASANTTNDSPGVTLLGGLGEAAESFDAVMYVLWDPAIPPVGNANCSPATTTFDNQLRIYHSTPSSCASIPVPLGKIEWSWSACTINQLTASGGPSWVKQCGPGKISAAVSTEYPQWSTCNSSDLAKCQ